MSSKTKKPASAGKEAVPVFTIERLRRDCLKLFGVTVSTFDGATCGLEGSYTVQQIEKIIKVWQEQPIIPVKKKGAK